MPRLTRLLPMLALAAAALSACGRDTPEPAADTAPDSAAPAAVVAPEPEPPRLTPAESAAAVARIQRAGAAKTREVRARIRELDPPPPDPPHVETPQTIYRSCLAQARSVPEPERSRLLEICERRRPPGS